MIIDKYERTLRQFEMYYPGLYKRSVDWWASGRMSISVELDDGNVFEYNPMDNSIRRIYTDSTDIDESVVRKAFGCNLQKMLPFGGVNQQELADKVGVSRVMMSKYIRGKAAPSIIVARKIANALRCTVDELFDDTYSS